MSAAVVITTLVPLGLGAKTSQTVPPKPFPQPIAEVQAKADYWEGRYKTEHKHRLKTKWLLGKRERRIVVLLKKLRGERNRQSTGRRVKAASTGSPRSIICKVFGSYCSQALRVAECESGFNVYARNGQYWGLYQFGAYARARYGFAWNAYVQARAAFRYFRDAGWGPWTCKP